MNAEPLDVALREIAETTALLESLIISSEKFDYRQAKRALRKLQDKSRDLAKLKAKLELLRKLEPNVCLVDFRAGQSAKEGANN